MRAACLEHLRTRIAEALARPPDRRRDNALSCSCAHCKQFSAYLADRTQKAWVLKAADHLRSHVDVDTATDRRGRPYSLVCTKNQATHERRAKQRTQDLGDLARLGG